MGRMPGNGAHASTRRVYGRAGRVHEITQMRARAIATEHDPGETKQKDENHGPGAGALRRLRPTRRRARRYCVFLLYFVPRNIGAAWARKPRMMITRA